MLNPRSSRGQQRRNQPTSVLLVAPFLSTNYTQKSGGWKGEEKLSPLSEGSFFDTRREDFLR